MNTIMPKVLSPEWRAVEAVPYQMVALRWLLVAAGAAVAAGNCLNLCSGHGQCLFTPNAICSCYPGYTGPDCAQKMCPYVRMLAGCVCRCDAPPPCAS